MKKGKRIASILVTLILVMGMIVGCGTKQETAKVGEQEKEKNDFPKKAITIICPFGAGGGTDLATRAIGEIAKKYLDTNVVIENKTGGAGAVGLSAGMNAKPDGYTLFSTCIELITLPELGLAPDGFSYKKVKPLVTINTEPSAITVRADAPWNTMEEFIAYTKENPGKVKIGNSGSGAMWHLAAMSLEEATDTEFLHVPYQEGAVQAITALLGEQIDAVAVSAAEVSANVAAGKLKILGVASEERLATFPDVPTYKEQGIDQSMSAFRGIGVPADTPDEIYAILAEAFNKAANDPECKELIEKASLTYSVMDAPTSQVLLDDQSEMLQTVIKRFNGNNE